MLHATSQPMPVTLAPARATDLDGLVAIRIAAMRDSLERIGRFDAGRARARLASGFVPDDTRHIVVDGARVGFVVARPDAGALLLEHLYVLPHAQGLGIGAAVLAQVLANADVAGLPVRVGALRDSDANRFYVRHGFQLVESGEFDNYYVRPCRCTS